MGNHENLKQKRKPLLKEFQKKSELKKLDGITLFPSAMQVFHEPSLEWCFKPLLSTKKHVLGKEYNIHLLSTDGIYLEKDFLNSESYFFGFKYLEGKYSFLGNLKAFGNSNFSELYQVLKKDFALKKDEYLEKKICSKEYYEINKEIIKNTARFTKAQDPQYFAEAFYCYEFTKYYFEKTGKFCHINEVTENYGHDENDILLGKDEIKDYVDEFFINLEDYFKNNYNLNENMAVCGTEGFRFTCYGGMSIAFIDTEQDIIYILEYHS